MDVAVVQVISLDNRSSCSSLPEIIDSVIFHYGQAASCRQVVRLVPVRKRSMSKLAVVVS